MGKYSEYDRASMSAAWRLVLWIIGIAVFIGLLTAGVLIVKSAFSEQKGQLDKNIKINSGDNQIQSQELFQDLHAKILEYDRNLDVAAATLAKTPSTFNQTNYDGLVMQCNSAVTQYNAEAGKVSRGKWKDWSLPDLIDQNDPRYDCKESAR